MLYSTRELSRKLLLIIIVNNVSYNCRKEKALLNRPAAIAANEATAATSTDAQPDAGGIIITDGIDVPFDDSGYAGHALPEVHEHQPALDQQIFLPFVQQ